MKQVDYAPRHPLVYFMVLIFGVIYSFFSWGEKVLITGCILAIGFLILEKRYKLAITLTLLYMVASVIQYAGISLQSEHLKSNVNGIAYILMDTGYSLKISIPIFCGISGILKVPEGKITSFFLKFRLPKSFSIGFCLFLRFLPTIFYEYKMIRSAQKFRNIGVTRLQTFITFPKVFVHVYVPFLMRTMVIGEEISVSMNTRGIRLDKDFTSYFDLQIKREDIFLLGYLAISVLVIGGLQCFV